MTKETYEIVIETLVKELELERWRLKEASKELEAEKQRYATLRKDIEDLRKELENGEF
jgi:cupin superfamily acireductone dioxygenase involved in methionine salvage